MPDGAREPTLSGFVAELRRHQRQQGRALTEVQVPQPAKDTFTVAASPASTYTLTAIPYQGTGGSSLNLSLNGLELVEGTDYTVDYTTAIVTVTATLKGTPTPADVLTADYWTTGDLIAASGPSDFGSISDDFGSVVNQHLTGRVTSDGHGTWVVPQGDWLTNGTPQGVVCVALSGIAYIETNSSDGIVQVTHTPEVAYTGVMVRYVDGSNHWTFQNRNTGGTQGKIVRTVAGTPTTVVSGLAVGTGTVTLKAVMSGSQVDFYAGSTLVYSDTSGTFSTATKHGMWANGNDSPQLFSSWSWTG